MGCSSTSGTTAELETVSRTTASGTTASGTTVSGTAASQSSGATTASGTAPRWTFVPARMRASTSFRLADISSSTSPPCRASASARSRAASIIATFASP